MHELNVPVWSENWSQTAQYRHQGSDVVDVYGAAMIDSVVQAVTVRHTGNTRGSVSVKPQEEHVVACRADDIGDRLFDAVGHAAYQDRGPSGAPYIASLEIEQRRIEDIDAVDDRQSFIG
jgi:hypothetical protein